MLRKVILIFFVFIITGCVVIHADEPEEVVIQTVENDDFAMDYIRFGQGEETLVILPGLSVQSVLDSAEAIVEAYQPLADDFTICLFDRRKELPEDYSMQEMARDTAEAIQLAGLDDIDLFGVSQGGMIAMEIAIEHPELVKKMVLGSVSSCETKELERVLDQWIKLAEDRDAEGLYQSFGETLYPEEVYEQSKEILTEAAKTVTDEDLDRFIILANSMKGFDITDELTEITCPVLLIGSEDDRALGADATYQIADHLNGKPGFELYMYDGYGHAAYDTAPDYKERLADFLMKE